VNEEKLRSKLERKLQRSVHPGIWRMLVKERYISEVLEGESDLDDLTERYLEVEGYFRDDARKPKDESRIVPPDQRGIALSKILANEASKDDDVMSYRKDYLNNILMSWEEAVAWIKEKKKEEGKPTLYIKELPIPENINVGFSDIQASWVRNIAKDLIHKKEIKPVGVLRKDLEYVTPEQVYTTSVPVKKGGALDSLRLLSETLSNKFNWPKAAASIFVLTGKIYITPKARITTHINPSYPALSTITIETLPSTSWREVENIFSESRKMLLGKGQRDKPITQAWRADLAVFVAEHNDGRSWREAMELWNNQHPVPSDRKRKPGEDYISSSTFARDGRQAYEKITGKRLLWGKDKGEGDSLQGLAVEQMKNMYAED
jgi:hypothetical protein